ncbi:MAG TPA: VOC family protein [Caulobacteraceae bacterium]|jgi:predicted enzyme related to lactoylglutathione lyase
MANVVGVGGVFIKTSDIEAWKGWYERVLGVKLEGFGGAIFPHPDIGHSLIAPFAADSDYFAPSPHGVMVNLIVDDLDGVLARAAEAGETPLWREDGDYGCFAHLIDPAGVKIELWQPPAKT